MFEEQIPQVTFTSTNEDGTVFCDASTFGSIEGLRSTSSGKRRAMMQERYDNWKELIANPPEETPEAPEEL